MFAIDFLILRILLTSILICLLFYVHKRLHKAELSFTLGIVWSIAILGALLLSIAPDLLSPITKLAGAELPVHFLFFMVQLFLVLIVFGLTLKSARQEHRMIRLTQEIALLRLENEQSNVLEAVVPSRPALVANQK